MGETVKTAIFGAALLAANAAMAQTPTMIPPASPAPQAPLPGTVLEQSFEYRFQLDLHVNDAALAKMLPAGWESGMATQGPAKDANVRLIFVDCLNIAGPDNKVLGKGTNRLAMLAAPVKKTGSNDVGQMILGGISEDSNVPDAFGAYLTASNVKVARQSAAVNGTVTETDDWDFTAAGGEHLRLHVKFIHNGANKGGNDTKFYNPADPSQYQIARTQMMTDVTRNVTTTPPDRVLEFSYTAGGGKYASLLEGSKPLSWDSQPFFLRTVAAP